MKTLVMMFAAMLGGVLFSCPQVTFGSDRQSKKYDKCFSTVDLCSVISVKLDITLSRIYSGKLDLIIEHVRGPQDDSGYIFVKDEGRLRYVGGVPVVSSGGRLYAQPYPSEIIKAVEAGAFSGSSDQKTRFITALQIMQSIYLPNRSTAILPLDGRSTSSDVVTDEGIFSVGFHPRKK